MKTGTLYPLRDYPISRRRRTVQVVLLHIVKQRDAHLLAYRHDRQITRAAIAQKLRTLAAKAQFPAAPRKLYHAVTLGVIDAEGGEKFLRRNIGHIARNHAAAKRRTVDRYAYAGGKLRFRSRSRAWLRSRSRLRGRLRCFNALRFSCLRAASGKQQRRHKSST